MKTGGNVDKCFDKLAKIGRFDGRAIDIVMEAMNDKNLPATVRYSAAQALGNIGKPGQVVIDALLQALKDENPNVRYSAAQALVKPGKTDSRIIDALVQLLKDRSSGYDVRSLAAEALGNIGKPDKVVIEALVQTLKDENSNVRYYATQVLVKLGKTDSRVIDVLVQALKDENSHVRSSAAQALGNLLQSKTDLELLEMLRHNDSGYRKAAAYALAEKHKKNPLSKETLQKIADYRTQDPRPWVRLAAWDVFYLLHEEKEGTSDD